MNLIPVMEKQFLCTSTTLFKFIIQHNKYYIKSREINSRGIFNIQFYFNNYSQ